MAPQMYDVNWTILCLYMHFDSNLHLLAFSVSWCAVAVGLLEGLDAFCYSRRTNHQPLPQF